MTVAALLKANAAAPDPATAALDQAVNERNALSSQNSQLWKLIEKQRSGYNQILKELERVRGERDAYKSKLGGGTNGRSSSDTERAPKRSFGGNTPTINLPSGDTKQAPSTQISYDPCMSPLTRPRTLTLIFTHSNSQISPPTPFFTFS